MSKANNPYRLARNYLAKDYVKKTAFERFSVIGAFYTLLLVTELKKSKRLEIKGALQHVKDMVFPYFSERLWLTHTVLNGADPDEQQLQDWRNAWLEHLATQWDIGEI
jgi:hypothetical protein